MNTADKITILHCHNGFAAKTYHGDGRVQPYSAGRYFRCEDLPCSSLDGLHSILVQLQDLPQAFIIRGAPVDGGALAIASIRRTKGNFRDVPRHWVMLDIDGVPLPSGIDALSSEALVHVVSLLPPEFQGVSFIAQWSNSAGLKPGVIKVHLWFWLETPLGSTDLRGWAKTLGALIDPAVFNTVQPHYTARPVFVDMEDPAPIRTLLVKLAKDAVSLVILPLNAMAGPAPATPSIKPLIAAPLGGKIADGREQWLLRERYRVLRGERPGSLEEFVELVWANFSATCETAPTPTSGNNYTSDSIAEKCQYDWEKYERGEFDFQRLPVATLPPFTDRTVPLDVGLAQLRGIVKSYFSEPKHTVVRITSGAGKTVAMCEEAVKVIQEGRKSGARKVIHLYLTTHNLKEEVAFKLSRLDPTLSIKNVIGRTPFTCERYGLTREVGELHLPVQRICCNATRTRGLDGTAFKHLMKCPHFDTCSYQNQFHGGADVYLFTKQYLQASRRADVAAPDYIIIDEEFTSTLVERRVEGLEDLLKLPVNVSAEAGKMLRVVRDALAMGEPVLRKLREAGHDANSLRQRALDFRQQRGRRLGLGILPGMRSDDIARQVIGIGPEHVGYLALKALANEIEHKRDDAYSVVYQDSELIVRLLRDSQVFQTPTLVLDATADQELVRCVLPDATFHAIEVPRKTHVIQVHDRRFSNTSLTWDKGKDKALALIQQFIDRLARQYRRVLLITFKDVKAAFTLPKGWVAAHYGAIRGLDAFKDFEAVVIVGTYLPPVQAVEHEAGALAARLPEQRNFTGKYDEVDRAFRLRSGSGSASMWGHTDPFVQRVLEQKREAEMLQAVDRLRLVHAQSPKPVLILSSLPLDLTVDELVTLEQLAGPGDYVGQLLDHLGGVIPLRASTLHERMPDLFLTEKAAEKWAAPYTPKPLIRPIRPTGVYEVRARAVGQRGPSDTRIMVRGDHPAPRAAIEHQLGDLSTYDGPEDREVFLHVTMPDTGRTVSARVLQFIKPARTPQGWPQKEMPPALYRVFHPQEWKERRETRA